MRYSIAIYKQQTESMLNEEISKPWYYHIMGSIPAMWGMSKWILCSWVIVFVIGLLSGVFISADTDKNHDPIPKQVEHLY